MPASATLAKTANAAAEREATRSASATLLILRIIIHAATKDPCKTCLKKR